MGARSRTSDLAKQFFDHFTDIDERPEIALGHDAMSRAFAFLTLAVGFRVTGFSFTQVRKRRPCRTTEPVKFLDGEADGIEFEPEDTTGRLAKQPGVDAHLADFGSAKTRFQLHVTNDAVRFQHEVVSAAVDLALEHLDIAVAVSPHEGKQLAEKNMTQCLLPQTRIEGVHRGLDVGERWLEVLGWGGHFYLSEMVGLSANALRLTWKSSGNAATVGIIRRFG